MTSDFLIIGGGIAGISAAARLSALGRVTLCEQEPALGYHASGRSAALFEPRYGKPAITALSEAGDTFLRHENGGVLSPRGFLMVAREDQREGFLAEETAMRLDRIAPAEACDIVPVLNPGKVALAAYHAAAWDIDTDRLIQNFAREARGNGAAILTGAPVTAISRTATGWRIGAGGETHDARMIVNAAGPWADGIARMAGVRPVGLVPYRRSMARIPAPGGHDISRWPMIFGPGEDWYARPDAGALLVSPGDEDPMEPHDAFADDMVLAAGLARYEAMVTEPVTRLLANWAGLRTFAPDRVLVIGPDRREPAFFWLAGQGGYGFQTSPAASRLAADLIAGRAPELGPAVVAALSPARFG
ncbi:MAG: FAD-binding oxidoreductase [Gemmobacter sp.]